MTCPEYPLVRLDYEHLFLLHIIANYYAVFMTNLCAEIQIKDPIDASTATMQTEQMLFFSYLELMMQDLNLDSYYQIARSFMRLGAVNFGKKNCRLCVFYLLQGIDWAYECFIV